MARVPTAGMACGKHLGMEVPAPSTGTGEADGVEPDVVEVDLARFADIHRLVVEELRDLAPHVPLSVADEVGRRVAEGVTDWPDFPERDADAILGTWLGSGLRLW